ncbi:MAG: GIY-YIG nuclease family protein, partial [Dehalococcoidia bacterium]|nr:GIY-YIG nuclease family protein [Dehalococcoidia bacterium]
QFSVYILELLDGSLYVGQTTKAVEDRMQDHIDGHKSGRACRRIGVRGLRHDLMEDEDLTDLTITSLATALRRERRVARNMANRGFKVHGGH